MASKSFVDNQLHIDIGNHPWTVAELEPFEPGTTIVHFCRTTIIPERLAIYCKDGTETKYPQLAALCGVSPAVEARTSAADSVFRTALVLHRWATNHGVADLAGPPQEGPWLASLAARICYKASITHSAAIAALEVLAALCLTDNTAILRELAPSFREKMHEVHNHLLTALKPTAPVQDTPKDMP